MRCFPLRTRLKAWLIPRSSKLPSARGGLAVASSLFVAAPWIPTGGQQPTGGTLRRPYLFCLCFRPLRSLRPEISAGHHSNGEQGRRMWGCLLVGGTKERTPDPTKASSMLRLFSHFLTPLSV